MAQIYWHVFIVLLITVVILLCVSFKIFLKHRDRHYTLQEATGYQNANSASSLPIQ